MGKKWDVVTHVKIDLFQTMTSTQFHPRNAGFWPGKYGIYCTRVYRFQKFCEAFLTRHPGIYIVPLKWNGSAVETLFSQFKHAVGRKFDSTNCATAREAYLVKKDTQSTALHVYHDEPIYKHEGNLMRR